MEEFLHRFIEGFASRMEGPFSFRMIIQPLMAVIFAIIDGLKDAKWGKPAYFWALFGSAEHRRELLKDGWKHFGKIFILGDHPGPRLPAEGPAACQRGGVVVAALVLAVLLLRAPAGRSTASRG